MGGRGWRARSGQGSARARRAAVTAVAASVLPGCGFSAVLDKRDSAASITGAESRAAAAGLAAGRLTVQLTVEKVRTSLPGLKEGFTTPPSSLALVVDVARGRAAVSSQVAGRTVPVRAFDDAVLYQLSAGTTSARPWVSFDMARAYRTRKDHAGEGFGNALLNPTFLFELLRGALTGSVHDLGPVDLDGVPTTHLTANFDATRAVEHSSRARREGLLAALALMSVDPESIHGDVWIDADGQARQITMRLRQRLTRRDVVAIDLTTTIQKVGLGGDVPMPPPESTARADDLGTIAGGLRGLASQLAGGGAAP
jgi:hypothetical protein